MFLPRGIWSHREANDLRGSSRRELLGQLTKVGSLILGKVDQALELFDCRGVVLPLELEGLLDDLEQAIVFNGSAAKGLHWAARPHDCTAFMAASGEIAERAHQGGSSLE